GAGILLGTTYLIRIDLGIFFTVVWLCVILLHAILLQRRIGFNLTAVCSLLLGVAAMHLPFLYDAYHRRFLPAFVGQYSNVANLILSPLLPHPSQKLAGDERQTAQLPATPIVSAENHAAP